MGGYGADEPLDSTLRFSSRSNKWKVMGKMNCTRFGMATLIIRNKIYVIGGRNNSGTFKSIEAFDLDKEEWALFEHDMMRPRNDFGAVFFNGQLWCLGGRGENSIERFDFSANTWELVGKLGNVRYGMSCVLYSLF
jgi:N-acetylneuraminic acid mutarotase